MTWDMSVGIFLLRAAVYEAEVLVGCQLRLHLFRADALEHARLHDLR